VNLTFKRLQRLSKISLCSFDFKSSSNLKLVWGSEIFGLLIWITLSHQDTYIPIHQVLIYILTIQLGLLNTNAVHHPLRARGGAEYIKASLAQEQQGYWSVLTCGITSAGLKDISNN
jgi:uncharacterized protein (UPF0248 family)